MAAPWSGEGFHPVDFWSKDFPAGTFVVFFFFLINIFFDVFQVFEANSRQEERRMFVFFCLEQVDLLGRVGMGLQVCTMHSPSLILHPSVNRHKPLAPL